MRLVSRTGFTLVELLLSLALSGVVLLVARAVLSTLEDGEARIARAAAEADAVANADRLLRDLLANTARTSVDPFVGATTAVSFSSRCPTSGGWSAPCRVRLALAATGPTRLLRLQIDDQPPLDLAIDSPVSALIYQERDVHTASWSVVWDRQLFAPNALGMLRGSDTLFFAVGAM